MRVPAIAVLITVALATIAFAEVGEVENKLDQAAMLLRKGDADGSEELIKPILNSLQGGSNPTQYERALRLMASVKQEKVERTQAESLLKKALAVEEKRPHPNRAEIVAICHDLEKLYVREQKFRDASFYCNKELEIKKDLFGRDDELVQDQYQSLLSLYDREIELQKSGIVEAKRKNDVARTKKLQSMVMSLYDEKISSTQLMRASTSQTFDTWYFRAKSAFESSDFTACEESLRNALKVLESNDIPNKEARLVHVRVLLAQAYQAEDKHKDAISTLNQVLSGELQAKEPDVRNLTLTLLAQCYDATSDIETSEHMYKQFLAEQANQRTAPDWQYAAALEQLAKICAQTGRKEEAERLLHQAIGEMLISAKPDASTQEKQREYSIDTYEKELRELQAKPLAAPDQHQLKGPAVALQTFNDLAKNAQNAFNTRNYPRCEEGCRKAIEILDGSAIPNKNVLKINMQFLLGEALVNDSRQKDAIAPLRAAAEKSATVPALKAQRHDFLYVLAMALHNVQDLPASERIYKEYLTDQSTNRTAPEWQYAGAMQELAQIYILTNRSKEAASWLRKEISFLRQVPNSAPYPQERAKMLSDCETRLKTLEQKH